MIGGWITGGLVFFRRRYSRLGVLINTARVFMLARHVTAGGFELACQVNELQWLENSECLWDSSF